jgi:hypothetical protein
MDLSFLGSDRSVCHSEGATRSVCHSEGATRSVCHSEGALATEESSISGWH